MKLIKNIKGHVNNFIYITKIVLRNPSRLLLPYLNGKCPYCKRWFVFPDIFKQSTAYENEDLNWICCCDDCFEQIEKVWEDHREGHYNSRGC